jgi:hypothetical protein
MFGVRELSDHQPDGDKTQRDNQLKKFYWHQQVPHLGVEVCKIIAP